MERLGRFEAPFGEQTINFLIHYNTSYIFILKSLNNLVMKPAQSRPEEKEGHNEDFLAALLWVHDS